MTMNANPRAVIGGNSPPEPTPFERVSKRIDDLYAECKLWLDGAQIENQAQADGLSNLMNMMREAAEEADEARKAENKPFDEGKAAVQAKYAPLIAKTKDITGKAPKAIDVCKKAIAPWLEKMEAEKRAVEEKARREAEEKRRAAEEAMRDAARHTDIAAAEQAEELVKAAKAAERAAAKATKDTAKAGGGVGRAVSLRSVWTAEMTDARAALGHYWKTRNADVVKLMQSLADADVRAGCRDLPGFVIREEKVAV